MPASTGLKPESSDATPSFRLKGGLFPLTLLEVLETDLGKLKEDLARKVAEAPAFFQQTPTVLSLEQIQQSLALDELCSIRDLCLDFGLSVIALRGEQAQLHEQAREMNLATLPVSKIKKTAPAITEKTEKNATEEPNLEVVEIEKNALPEQQIEAQAEANHIAEVSEPLPPATETKIITTPVRSGQQIYAAGGDLIVMAPVSAGAEILSDGNIHVYGAARGRILAGVRGNQSARIFCQSLEAELVSIAGYFKINEDLRGAHWKQSVQVFLTDETLNIDPLSK